MKKGLVYLIGAGPGDPGLLTVKGAECLGRADVVVYDFLANPALLSHAAPGTEIIYVGKKGADHTMPQVEINRLLVELAGAGRIVARLKGGDPYVFGRGGEEAEELAEAEVPFEVVPGVTSAIAAPAYAGIPVTHRRHTSNVGFITGHEDPTKPDSALDWDKIAGSFGTLVFLMGIKNIETIANSLMAAGRPPDTPAAVIRWGTTPSQVTVTATLADVTEKVRAARIKPPAVLIVGTVVELRDRLNWFERLPLFGRVVLVTRTREQASGLTKRLAALGARVIECPTIRLTPPEDWDQVDQAIGRISSYDWVVLTSPNGVEYFGRRLLATSRDARALAGVKIAAIGPATADKLAGMGLRADLLPEEFVAEGLVRAMVAAGLEGKKVLLARAAEARDVLPLELAKGGALVDEVALYQTRPPENLTPEAQSALDEGAVDLVTFTSSSTVTNLVTLLGSRLESFRARVQAASIGPITTKTARQAGLNVTVEARSFTVDGLVAAMVEHFASRE